MRKRQKTKKKKPIDNHSNSVWIDIHTTHTEERPVSRMASWINLSQQACVTLKAVFVC